MQDWLGLPSPNAMAHDSVRIFVEDFPGSYSLDELLSFRCYCGDRMYPLSLPSDMYCWQCTSEWNYWAICQRLLAHNSIFNNLPGPATDAVWAFAADSTRRLFYTSMLSYVLLARDSPFRAFRYYSNGLAGNISDKEDILDRIVGFL